MLAVRSQSTRDALDGISCQSESQEARVHFDTMCWLESSLLERVLVRSSEVKG